MKLSYWADILKDLNIIKLQLFVIYRKNSSWIDVLRQRNKLFSVKSALLNKFYHFQCENTVWHFQSAVLCYLACRSCQSNSILFTYMLHIQCVYVECNAIQSDIKCMIILEKISMTSISCNNIVLKLNCEIQINQRNILSCNSQWDRANVISQSSWYFV